MVIAIFSLQACMPNAHAQISGGQPSINPAASFLRLAPDARSGAMGEISKELPVLPCKLALLAKLLIWYGLQLSMLMGNLLKLLISM